MVDRPDGARTPRLLATVTNNLNTAGITLRFTIGGSNTDGAVNGAVTLYAGQTISAVEVRLGAGDTFDGSNQRIKFVLSTVDDAAATAGGCLDSTKSLGPSHVTLPFANTLGATTSVTGASAVLGAEISPNGLDFRMGGSYKLCFSNTGAFTSGNVDVLDVTSNVNGVFDPCTTSNCLAEKRYNCYALKGTNSAQGSCALNYRGTGKGFTGNVGKASWSKAWVPAWDASGVLQSLPSAECGSTTPDSSAMCPQGPDPGSPNCTGDDFFVEPDATQDNKVVILPMTQALSSAQKGYTIAACYCPDLSGCSSTSHFVQQIGIVYIFTSKVCDSSATCNSGATGFAGVAVKRSFTVLVNCAPGGCATNSDNRIKLINRHVDNDKPSWDPQNGCQKTLQTSLQSKPTNCHTSSDCDLSGGTRQDWKLFGNSQNGFELAVPNVMSDYELRNFHSTQSLDVCFCASGCTSASNWFKVGQLDYSPYRLVNLDADQLSIVNVPGLVGLYRGNNDLDSLGLVAPSLVKLVLEPSSGPEVDDAQCRTAPDNLRVTSLTHATSKAKHEGTARGDKSIVFDKGNPANTYTASSAGIVAMCYCPEANCPVIGNSWVLAARFTIHGPTGGQAWTFSTGLSVRLTFSGFGLNSNGTLRVVGAGTSCNSGGGNPDGEQSLQVSCPACQGVTNAPGLKGNLATSVVQQDSVDCDINNANCRSVFLIRVTVISAVATELEFAGNPGLSSGDRLLLGTGLGTGVQCGANCNAEQLAAVTGRRSFGNSGNYEVGVRIAATAAGNKFVIPVGWTGTRPKFTVTQGDWVRTSSASTATELKGTLGKAGLKVCWGRNGDGTFATEVGRITFSVPPVMSAAISLVTLQAGKQAPFVLSFTTRSLADYNNAAVSMQLSIRFLRPDLLEPLPVTQEPFSTLSGAAQDPEGANQVTCGRLFLELWSTDSTKGFPLPQGCFHTLTGNVREFHFIFEQGNGFEGGKSYQIVLMGIGKVDMKPADEVVEVIAKPVQQPFLATEVGKAKPNKQPSDGPTQSSPQFRYGLGPEVLGGVAGLLELTGSELDLRVRLAGDSKGRIVKFSMFRLFLYPLTQWNMAYKSGNTCVATCEPSPGTVCGNIQKCAIEPVVAGAQKNVIHMQLPTSMADVHGLVQHTIRIRSLTLPTGGFFAGRIGAQVSTMEDRHQHYAVSHGDSLWKQPGAGATVASLVSSSGDGNSRPFRGETGNMLHARLVLGATLRRWPGPSSAAAFSVQLPVGYQAIRVSRAPGTLSALAGPAPTGHGSLDVQKWVCTANRCTYSLALNEAISAGSVMFASFLVNNPTSALPSADAANRWSVSLHSTGVSPWTQTASPVTFSALAGSSGFSANVAVLGKLREYSAQPTDFSVAQVMNRLLVFFKPEQKVGPGGFVVVDAPGTFDLGQNCNASNLEATYYAGLGLRTLPLPGLAGCSGDDIDPQNNNERNRAKLQFQGNLQAMQHYAFGLTFSNPSVFNASQLSGWHLRTMTMAQQVIDSTSTPLRFNPLESGGTGKNGALHNWGLFGAALEPPPVVAFSSRKPFGMTGEAATATVFPLRTGRDLETSLRIVAPFGFEWLFSEQDFIASAGGATAAMPGGTPSRDRNVLTWPAARYLQNQSYGFAAKIRVPQMTPRTSSNAFFVEFGYSDLTLDDTSRSFAARIEAPIVQALSNAAVESSTSAVGRPSAFSFRVKTVTVIPQGGGLLVQGPAGFLFSETCHAGAIAGGAYTSLPSDVRCTFQMAASGESQLSLMAGRTGMAAAEYEFQLEGFNPAVPMNNFNVAGTTCGWTHCWTFFSVRDLALPLAAAEELDARVSVPGFAIKAEMPHAHLVPLSDAARSSISRDDRPSKQNRLTFGFRLGRNIVQAGELVLRGPSGFAFKEDCLASDGVITQHATISATAGTLLAQHGTWETGVPVTACAGSGSIARLQIGAGLRREKKYLFTIRVQANPVQTPLANTWSLESALEASAQFNSFPLWTFTESVVSVLSTAAGATLPNFVNLTFTPYNTVPAGANGGGVVVTAPAGFGLTNTGGNCPHALEERDPLQGWQGTGGPVSVFSKSEVYCRTGSNANVVRMTLPSSKSIIAGRSYTLTLLASNPTTVTQEGEQPGQWRVETFRDGVTLSSPIDSAHMSSSRINKALLEWSYVNGGGTTQIGGMAVKGLKLSLTFPDTVSPGDVIEILAPPAYNLASPTNHAGDAHCNNFQWSSTVKALPFTAASRVLCQGHRLTIQLANALVNNTAIQFLIDTRNPQSPATWGLSHWHAKHVDAAGITLSSSVIKSWAIIPHLDRVDMRLTGKEVVAGSTSTLEFQFVPKSTAGSLILDAQVPAGFDFANSFLPTNGQSRLAAVFSTLKVRVNMVPGVLVHVIVRDVKLATVGGQTQFALTTYSTVDATAPVADQLSGFTAFRLPGSMNITEPDLRNEFQLGAGLHPIKSLWRVQMSTNAVVSFIFGPSNDIEAGEVIIVKSSAYQLARTRFGIFVQAQTPQPVPSAVAFAAAGELRATLEQRLRADLSYRISVGVVTPSTQPRADADTWEVMTSDGGLLPTSSSGVVKPNFQLVAPFAVRVTAERRPPMAPVEVSIQLSFGMARPTSLTVVAPVGINFAKDCLVVGGAAITSCVPGPAFSGRPTARLACNLGLTVTSIQGLKLRVNTPAQTPSIHTWLIEGLDKNGDAVGWGEDSIGFELQQMRDVSFTYAGIPGIETQLAVGFRTSEKMDRGSQVEILKPEAFQADSNIASISTISLPPVLDCDVHKSSIVLRLGDTLQGGEYAFAITLKTPSTTPASNKWSLLLKSQMGFVQDAAVDIPGKTIHPGIKLVSAPLRWTSSDAGQASTITMGFVVAKTIAPNRLGELLITLPANFAHAIEQECSVQSSNAALPLLASVEGCKWVDIQLADRVVIHLDPNREVPPGTYELSFPVTVPEQMPAYNVWLLTFCQPASGSGTCLQAHSSNAVLTFPSPGFGHGGTSAIATAALPAAAMRSRASASFWASCTFAAFLQLSYN